jgi:hypothetical protein
MAKFAIDEAKSEDMNHPPAASHMGSPNRGLPPQAPRHPSRCCDLFPASWSSSMASAAHLLEFLYGCHGCRRSAP